MHFIHISDKGQKSMSSTHPPLQRKPAPLWCHFSRGLPLHSHLCFCLCLFRPRAEGEKKRIPKPLKWIIRVEHAVTASAKSLWQPQTCMKEPPQRKREGRSKDGGTKTEKNTTRATWSSKKSVSLDDSCSALMANRCYSSTSIQQLVPNPLGRNASPIPLSACLRHTADRRLSARRCALRGPVLFPLCSHGPACMRLSRSCIRVNGSDSRRSHSGHINVCCLTKTEVGQVTREKLNEAFEV